MILWTEITRSTCCERLLSVTRRSIGRLPQQCAAASPGRSMAAGQREWLRSVLEASVVVGLCPFFAAASSAAAWPPSLLLLPRFQHPLSTPGASLQLIIFSHFASLPVRIFLWPTAALWNVSPPFPIVGWWRCSRRARGQAEEASAARVHCLA